MHLMYTQDVFQFFLNIFLSVFNLIISGTAKPIMTRLSLAGEQHRVAQLVII